MAYDLSQRGGTQVGRLEKKEFCEKAREVEFLVLDVDGVLTDGKITYNEDGVELKSFDVKDGHGLVLAREAGLKLAFMSGRVSKVTQVRANNLKIKTVRQGIRSKGDALCELAKEFDVDMSKIAFMGDDTIDIPAMEIAGLSIAVADAHEKTIEAADWVTIRCGGNGAVREVLDIWLEGRS